MGILKLSERGVLYNLRNKWFNANDTVCDNSGSTNDDGQFDMDAVGGLFVVLIVGIFVSFMIGLAEFLWHVHRTALKERVRTVARSVRVFLNGVPLAGEAHGGIEGRAKLSHTRLAETKTVAHLSREP